MQSFEYQTVQETAQAWGVTKRWVNMCIAGGRVPGAVKTGHMWLVPKRATKPESDGRRPAPPQEDPLFANLTDIIEATTMPWPASDPDAILTTVEEERLRLPYEGELAYLRGDFERVVQCFRQSGTEDAAKLRACSLTIAAAVGTGDYPLYLEVETYLNNVVEAHDGDERLAVFEELCLATAYTGAIAPSMVPKWLQDGDFSALPPKARPDAAYKRAKYFQCLGKFDSMLAIAQTALSFCACDGQLSFHAIYFRVACAIACAGLRQESAARRWLSEALALALPHGFILPFAESATAFGGLLEQLLEQEYPTCLNVVTTQWQCTFVNWISFHNQFTRDNITSMLSLREHEMASLVVQRVPRAQIAEQFHISPGRLNNIMKEIYGKLYVSGREELSKFIL